ncbi:MAG: hypothetical protein GYA17_18050 [Chloroflexi bacterium]|nr:hypothetical protein [Anaerolineaceae bacterium]NMB90267.1 hypothetical protein [Chloroflexota bacterium]
MNKPVVVIGLGQIGSVFAQGFLLNHHPVYPIRHDMDAQAEAGGIPEPQVVLVAVREETLHAILQALPPGWSDRLALVQNELLPRDWESHHLPHPSVATIWFEKRKDRPADSYYPSVVYGPQAGLVEAALQSLGLPTRRAASAEEMLYEMVRKNLYIVAKNIAGMAAPGNVGSLWAQHHDLFVSVAREVLAVQAWLAGRPLPTERLLAQLGADVEGQPEKGTAGGSAPGRLARAIGYADLAGLEVPQLRQIQANASGK